MSSLLRLNPDALRDALAAVVRRELGAQLLRFESVAPGLGNRRFFRLHLAAAAPFKNQQAPPSSVIARIEAEEDPSKRAAGVAPEPLLEPLRSFLETAGIPVPKRTGGDLDLGVELLEDVGALSLEREAHTAEPLRRQALYAEACALIPRLQRLEAPDPPVAAFGRRLDRALIESKAQRVVDWALPFWLGRSPTRAQRDITKRTFSHIADVCADAPQRLSHRDMKAANIHLRKNAPEGSRLVLIDLQGAFMAPPEYDLVCLLRDSHVPLPSDEIATHLAATRPALPDAPTPETFSQRFTLLTLSRVAKDAAHYIHAFTGDRDSRYLHLVPAARQTLGEAASRAARGNPDLEPFANLVQMLREPQVGSGGETSA